MTLGQQKGAMVKFRCAKWLDRSTEELQEKLPQLQVPRPGARLCQPWMQVQHVSGRWEVSADLEHPTGLRPF